MKNITSHIWKNAGRNRHGRRRHLSRLWRLTLRRSRSLRRRRRRLRGRRGNRRSGRCRRGLLLSRLRSRRRLSWRLRPQNVQTARRTSLLTLKPRTETRRVEYVIARQLFGTWNKSALAKVRVRISKCCIFKSPVVISSRQMMQTLSTAASSAAVASGYSVFMFLMALLDIMTSLKALLKFLE